LTTFRFRYRNPTLTRGYLRMSDLVDRLVQDAVDAFHGNDGDHNVFADMSARFTRTIKDCPLHEVLALLDNPPMSGREKSSLDITDIQAALRRKAGE
jgi:hypothetical protein